jgi:transaldolase
MKTLEELKVKIFADGADPRLIRALSLNPLIEGFTTNPTLMRKAGVTDYESFASEILKIVPDRPVSFEVFADELEKMEEQALEMASWGANVNVKIPVTNTRGTFTGPLVRRLSKAGVPVNVTACMGLDQVKAVADILAPGTPAFVSVFAGRIADSGRDPLPIMAEAVRILEARPKARLIWASPRELLNIFHADAVGCHVITVTADILEKLSLVGKDLAEYSQETVRMFYRDAKSAGYHIRVKSKVLDG